MNITVGLQFMCCGHNAKAAAIHDTWVYIESLDNPASNMFDVLINGCHFSYRWIDFTYRIESGLSGNAYSEYFCLKPFVNTPTTQFGDDT